MGYIYLQNVLSCRNLTINSFLTLLRIAQHGKSPLMYACAVGYGPVVKALLESIKTTKYPNTAINEFSSCGLTALMFAVAGDHIVVSEMMIAAGCRLDLTTKVVVTCDTKHIECSLICIDLRTCCDLLRMARR